MTTTLGQALTAGDSETLNLDDASIRPGFDKASQELGKGPDKSESAALDSNAMKGALKKNLLKALDIALDDILGQAWSGWSELRKYADPQQTPPEDINVVTVSNHTIESNLEPSVDVVVHDIKMHSFDFYDSVQLQVQGVNLEVQGGAITAIRVGHLQLGGSIRLGDRSILEKDLAEVTIPGAMRLEKPIPILRDTA